MYGISRALTTKPARSWLRITFLPSTLGGEVVGGGDRLGRRQQARHQLDQAQHRDRVEEVDADHLLGPLGGDAELHDRDRAGVAGEDRRRVGDDLVEGRGTRRPSRLVLDDGLDDELAVGQLAEVGGERGAGRRRRRGASSVELAGAHAPVERRRRRVPGRPRPPPASTSRTTTSSPARAHTSAMPGTHQPAADHADPFDVARGRSPAGCVPARSGGEMMCRMGDDGPHERRRTDARVPGPAGPLRHPAPGRSPARHASGPRGRWRRSGPFVETAPMFFLATADRRWPATVLVQGRSARASCGSSAPMELCFPNYDGNGMYLSTGNLVENPRDRAAVHRLRAPRPGPRLGTGHRVDPDDPLTATIPRRPVRRAGRRRRGVPELPALHPPDGASRSYRRSSPARRRRRPRSPSGSACRLGMRRAPGRRSGPWLSLALPADVPGPRRHDRRRRLLVRRRRRRPSRPDGRDRPRRRHRPTTRRRQRPTPPTTRRRRPHARPPRPPTADRPCRCAADPFALGVAAGDPDATSAVLWTRLIGADLPDAVDVTWEVADRRGLRRRRRPPARRRRGRRRPQRPRRRRARRPGAGTASAPAGGRARSAGRAGSGRRRRPSCASPPARASTGRPASTPPTATSPSGRPTWSCSSATSSTRAPAQPVGEGRVRSHDGPEPTDLAGYRARYAQYLSDADLQAARPPAVARDLGRPRGREQLRRPRSRRTPPTRRRSRPAAPPRTRRGGSTCPCASRRPATG